MEVLLPMMSSLGIMAVLLRFTDENVHKVHMMCHIPTESVPSPYTVHTVSSLGQEGEEHLD